MINNKEYFVRKATLNDVDFIIDTIIAAEKSGTNNLGLAKLFELTEMELRNYLLQILNEEIGGCEFSIDSFLVATYQEQPVSAFAGWIEGNNEDEIPSALIKSNLINFIFPKNNIIKSANKKNIVESIQIQRESGTYQLEYSYTHEKHRGRNLIGKIINEHMNIAKQNNIKRMQVHVFSNNDSAIKSYLKQGFKIMSVHRSENPMTSVFFPANEKILMEINIE